MIADARRTLDHWYELTAEAADGAPLCADVLEALEDDLNTPQAIAALHALRAEAAKGAKPAAACLKASARLMGLLQSTPAEWKAWRPATLAVDDKAIEAMIAARNAARKGRNFKEADRIRDELTAMGIQLKDAKDPATGEIVTTWECAPPARRRSSDEPARRFFARQAHRREAAGWLVSASGAWGACAGVLGESADGIAVGAGIARKGRCRRRRQSCLLRNVRCGACGFGNRSLEPGHIQAARHYLPPL